MEGCKLFIANFFESLIEGGATPSINAKTFAASCDRLLQYPDDVRFDLVLAWDLFNYLGLPEVQVLAQRLVALSRPGTRIMALVSIQKQIPDRPLRFTIRDQKTLRYEVVSAGLRACPRHNEPDLLKRMAGSRWIRACSCATACATTASFASSPPPSSAAHRCGSSATAPWCGAPRSRSSTRAGLDRRIRAAVLAGLDRSSRRAGRPRSGGDAGRGAGGGLLGHGVPRGAAERDAVLATLDHREKGGYDRRDVTSTSAAAIRSRAWSTWLPPTIRTISARRRSTSSRSRCALRPVPAAATSSTSRAWRGRCARWAPGTSTCSRSPTGCTLDAPRDRSIARRARKVGRRA